MEMRRTGSRLYGHKNPESNERAAAIQEAAEHCIILSNRCGASF